MKSFQGLKGIMKDTDYKDLFQEYLMRFMRVGIFLSILFILAFGIFYGYMISKNKDIAHMSGVLLGHILIVVALGVIFYVCFTPIITWIWSGNVRFYGENYEGDVLTPTILLSFVLIVIGIVVLYQCGMYTVQIDRFTAWVNRIISF